MRRSDGKGSREVGSWQGALNKSCRIAVWMIKKRVAELTAVIGISRGDLTGIFFNKNIEKNDLLNSKF